jgi:hypothetical protein
MTVLAFPRDSMSFIVNCQWVVYHCSWLHRRHGVCIFLIDYFHSPLKNTCKPSFESLYLKNSIKIRLVVIFIASFHFFVRIYVFYIYFGALIQELIVILLYTIIVIVNEARSRDIVGKRHTRENVVNLIFGFETHYAIQCDSSKRICKFQCLAVVKI